MNYTLEGFLKLYDELREAENKHSNSTSDKLRYYSNIVSQKRAEIEQYGKELLQQHPSDKEIACTVYAGLPLGSGAYTSLSDELKNDKLVTLLALNNFDQSSYANIGDKLKSDKEVMFALAKNTTGVLSVTEFSKTLANDKSFWVELLSDAYRTSTQSIDNVLSEISKINDKYQLNLNLEMITSTAHEITSIKESPLETYYYRAYLTPHRMQSMFQGDVEKIEDITKYLGNKTLNELLLAEATKAKKQKEGNILEESTIKIEHDEINPTVENDISIDNSQKLAEYRANSEIRKKGQEEETAKRIEISKERETWHNSKENPSNKRIEELKEMKELLKTLTALKKINPNLLSDEQNKILKESETYLEMLNKANNKSHQIDTGMSEEMREWYQNEYAKEETKNTR